MKQHENVKQYVIGTYRYVALFYVNNFAINSVNKLSGNIQLMRFEYASLAALLINYDIIVKKDSV